MAERKLFKTKLCVLYQKGRCSRPSCSFAHGHAELRRISGGYGGRRDYRGVDLRDKLEQRYSPPRARDLRGQRAVRGYSSSRSLERLPDKKRRKKPQVDGQSDFSGSLRISDRSVERVREDKVTSSASRDALEEQLKKVLSDISVVEHRKYQVGVYLDEKTQESDSLTSRIQELESQLYKEKEECKRITSKIKKFVKAHNRYSRMQAELNRSQARLERLGDQLGSDVTRTGADGEDSSINIVSDGEAGGLHIIRSQNGSKKSPSKKRLDGNEEDLDGFHQADESKVHRDNANRSKRLSRWNVHPARTIYESKFAAVEGGTHGSGTSANEAKHKRGRTISNSISPADKARAIELGLPVPSTSIAAHAIDEEADIEPEERCETVSLGNERGMTNLESGLPFKLPPPPPILPSTYSQYKGDNQNAVAAVGRLEEETTHVDIV